MGTLPASNDESMEEVGANPLDGESPESPESLVAVGIDTGTPEHEH